MMKKLIKHIVIAALVASVGCINAFAVPNGNEQTVVECGSPNEEGIATASDFAFQIIANDGVALVRGGLSKDGPQRLIVPAKVTIQGKVYKVTQIGDGAFRESATTIEAVVLPEGITHIGKFAFEYSNIADIKIPNTVITIDDCAFRYSKLKSCVLSNQLRTIKRSTFQYCTYLTEITIPSSVISIGQDAFSGCGFQEIRLPSSVQYINDGAFAFCKMKEIQLPDGLLFLGNHAFEACENLTSISLPASLRNINTGTFADCKNLVSVTIPSTIRNIWYEAFANCNSLKTVKIPSQTKVWESAFVGCPIQ